MMNSDIRAFSQHFNNKPNFIKFDPDQKPRSNRKELVLFIDSCDNLRLTVPLMILKYLFPTDQIAFDHYAGFGSGFIPVSLLNICPKSEELNMASQQPDKYRPLDIVKFLLLIKILPSSSACFSIPHWKQWRNPSTCYSSKITSRRRV